MSSEPEWAPALEAVLREAWPAARVGPVRHCPDRDCDCVARLLFPGGESCLALMDGGVVARHLRLDPDAIRVYRAAEELISLLVALEDFAEPPGRERVVSRRNLTSSDIKGRTT